MPSSNDKVINLNLKKKTQDIKPILDELFKFLCDFNFPVNRRRRRVRRDGQGVLKSTTFGRVTTWGPCNDDKFNNVKRTEISQISLDNPELHKMLFALGRHLTNKKYTSCCVNDSYQMKKHVDQNNVGSSFCFGIGPYEGGELRIYGDDGSYEDHDIRNGVVFNGSEKYHEVLEFKGRRFSLIYYSI